MSQIKISVIIPTHNRPDKIADTVAALRQQTLPATDYEILVMDDGSTPPVVLTGEIENPKCRVLRLEGVERSAARNAGAAAAQGGLLVFVDDDISVGRDFLASHLTAHTEWPEALLVGAISLPNEALATPFGRFRQKLEQQGVPHKRGVITARNFCAAANMSIVRTIFQNLQGFDPRLSSGEDQDLALRYSNAGGHLAYVPEAKAIHFDSALDIKSYCQRTEWGSENMTPFCQRYADGPDNIERTRINGSLRFGQEPFGLSLRKIVKAVLGRSPFLNGLFHLTILLERTMPQSTALDRLYRLLLGIHLQRGYRKGLKKLSNPIEAQHQPAELEVNSL